MPQYTYTAQASDGQIQRGSVEADTKAAALSALQARELRPLSVTEAKKSLKDITIALPGQKKVKANDLVIFTRQFATMINAGVPMVKSLSTMRDQTDSPALRSILDDVTAKVEGGIQLSEALANHPKVFSGVYTNMIRAGEEGGILDQIMERLAGQVEKDAEIKGKLRSALIYPGVITVVAIGAVTFLVTNIIPKFGAIFDQVGAELPIQTRMMLGLSDFLINYGLLLLGAIVLTAIATLRFVKTERGRFIFDSLLLKAPIFGPVLLKINVARFSNTFSSLTSAGVSVVKSLEVTSGALSNTVIKRGISESVEKITNGQPISKSLSETNIFPAIVTQMTAVGEETGQIDTVLEKVAEFYSKEVDRTIEGISSIIEPVLIVGLGGVVGLIVASIFGPLAELTQIM
ncbi:MAG: type II secretion system F family protein [Candidatus Saccharimonadales bacterium]